MKKIFAAGALLLLFILLPLNVKGEELDGETRDVWIEQEVLFEAVEQRTKIPEVLEILYEDVPAGFVMNGMYPIRSAKAVKETWTDDFVADVTFYAYDAPFYELGEYRVPAAADGPGLNGYEGELLRQLGLPAQDYVILNVEWAGEPYQNREGILCRDAAARGKKRVKDYQAVFGGWLSIPAEQPPVLNLDAAVETPGSGTENLREADETGLNAVPSKRQLIMRVLLVSVAMGLMLFLLAALYVFIRRKRSKKKKEKEENK